ncbi:LPXTG cell wall anchor domain-containing protein [Latilactobacillus sakei]|uniref:LPXTG cell wall anchor domain-containing protein n=1 Tax=Latilactobacillus sakei TaxID=1599 RepID=UPI003F535F25
MTHKITKLFIACLAIFLGNFVLLSSHPTQAADNSTVSFVINYDKAAPGDGGSGINNGNGGVEQPHIPGNGQEIHYEADGSSTGKLPQTGVLQNSILGLIGTSLILIVLIWRQARRETEKEG